MNLDLITLGSEYAKNTIPDGILNENSIYYGFGVGEDISFDIEIVKRYSCNAYIFDPTPRSKVFWGNKEKHYPDVSKEIFDKISFFDYGLWDKNTTVKFYEPANKEHVSHSIDNLQKTDDGFVGIVFNLETIMKVLGHKNIDLLKLDIEGAEYSVIDDMLKHKINVKIFITEFHDVVYDNIKTRATEYTNKLIAADYALLASINNGATLIKKTI